MPSAGAHRDRPDRSQQLGEPVEEVRGVMRASGCLRVVLNGEGWAVKATQALDDAVVQADVAGRHPPEPRLDCPEPRLAAPELCLSTPGPCLSTPGPCLSTPGPCLSTPGPCLGAPGPCLGAPGPCLGAPGPCLGAPGPCIGARESRGNGAEGIPSHACLVRKGTGFKESWN